MPSALEAQASLPFTAPELCETDFWDSLQVYRCKNWSASYIVT